MTGNEYWDGYITGILTAFIAAGVSIFVVSLEDKGNK